MPLELTPVQTLETTTCIGESDLASELGEVGPALHAALRDLARGESTDLDAFIEAVEVRADLAGTHTIMHCYSVTLDGNGLPRTQALIQALVAYVLDFAIPRRALLEAFDEFGETKSSAAIVELHNQARSLFTKLDQSGEGGELLLFVLAETVLRLPQLVCKMDLKTSENVHVHGADGLHAGVDQESGKLRLYWGESKFNASFNDAVFNCMKSIAPLIKEEFGAQDRDRQLLLRNLNVENKDLYDALKQLLNPKNRAYRDVAHSGLCLVGFDYDAYPSSPGAMQPDTLIEALIEQVPNWKQYVVKREKVEGVEGYHVHLFLLPCPSVEEYRSLFRKAVGIDK